MKLAIELAGSSARRTAGGRPDRYSVPVGTIRHLEHLGWEMVFTAEALGPDGLTPLGYILAATERIGVGVSALSIAARSPATTAVSMQTLKALAGPDRDVVLTVAVGYAMWAEGWHGVSWANPYGRMRDYVDIVKRVLAGDDVRYGGRHLQVPFPGPGRLGDGRTFNSTVAMEGDVPILIGGGSQRMVELAAEIADGYNPMSFSPGAMSTYQPMFETGFARGGRPAGAPFNVWAHVDFTITDDVVAGMHPFKRFVARQIAMRPGNGNVYRQQLLRDGMAAELERIEALQGDGQYERSVDAVPDEYVDEHFLVGPMQRVLTRARRWSDAGLAGLIVRPGAATLDAAGFEDLEVWKPLTTAFRG